MRQRDFKRDSNCLWSSLPNHYIIDTDQAILEVDAHWLDYKKTIMKLREQGYTNIHIVCVGKAIRV